VGEWLPEPLVASADDDPAGKAEMADSLSYSREPHVKVDDYVDPASCGGESTSPFDSANARIIVDHIGLHL
jgi:hypothetical protein